MAYPPPPENFRENTQIKAIKIEMLKKTTDHELLNVLVSRFVFKITAVSTYYNTKRVD